MVTRAFSRALPLGIKVQPSRLEERDSALSVGNVLPTVIQVEPSKLCPKTIFRMSKSHIPHLTVHLQDYLSDSD